MKPHVGTTSRRQLAKRAIQYVRVVGRQRVQIKWSIGHLSWAVMIGPGLLALINV